MSFYKQLYEQISDYAIKTEADINSHRRFGVCSVCEKFETQLRTECLTQLEIKHQKLNDLRKQIIKITRK
jgi:hypothetical protein